MPGRPAWAFDRPVHPRIAECEAEPDTRSGYSRAWSIVPWIDQDPDRVEPGTRRMGPTSERPGSRAIPREVLRFLQTRSGDACEYPGCTNGCSSRGRTSERPRRRAAGRRSRTSATSAACTTRCTTRVSSRSSPGRSTSVRSSGGAQAASSGREERSSHLPHRRGVGGRAATLRLHERARPRGALTRRVLPRPALLRAVAGAPGLRDRQRRDHAGPQQGRRRRLRGVHQARPVRAPLLLDRRGGSDRRARHRGHLGLGARSPLGGVRDHLDRCRTRLRCAGHVREARRQHHRRHRGAAAGAAGRASTS